MREAWEAGQRAGYDVLVMEPMSSDPALCLSRADAAKRYTLEQLAARGGARRAGAADVSGF